MQRHSRRANDRQESANRRAVPDRRHDAHWSTATRFPGWQEQKVQFLTRYLFMVLGILFFNFSGEFKPTWLTLPQLNTTFGLYFVINSFGFAHASRHTDSTARYRAAM